MKFILRILIMFFIGLTAAAEIGFNLKMELESKLQDKVRSVLHPYDPEAVVLVNISLKKVSAVLPGMGGEQTGDLYLTSDTDQLTGADIESVELNVLSRHAQLPESLTQLIKKSINLPKVKVNYKFEQLETEVVKAISDRESRQSGELSQERWEKFIEHLSIFSGHTKSQTWAQYAMGLLIAAACILSALLFKDIFHKDISQISQAIKSSGNFMNAPIGLQPQAESRTTAKALASSDANSNLSIERQAVQALSSDALLSLMTDCYWCEEDNYAEWLWLNMSNSQRQEFLIQWQVANEYVRTFSSSPKILSYHTHPYYLQPLKLWNVSQTDLANMLKLNPSFWHFISPVRQANMKIPLIEKLEYASSEIPKSIPTNFVSNIPVTGGLRKLPQSVLISSISELDEIEILKNPERVPTTLRAQVSSLVWLLLLAKPQQEEILSKMSAQQIAQAWIGPKEVLEQVAALVGEKKLKLLNDYRRTTTPDRNSVPMQYIVQQSLKLIEEKSDHVSSDAA